MEDEMDEKLNEKPENNPEESFEETFIDSLDNIPRTAIPKNSFMTRGCCHEPKAFPNNCKAFKNGFAKLDMYNWLGEVNLPDQQSKFDCVEVRFKNSRKDFYRIPGDQDCHIGEFVAVESSPGHDIGIISATGEVVRMQMLKKGIDCKSDEIKKVYRKARLADIEKWITAVDNEDRTMNRSRQIAEKLGLSMKINDVEYQGDNTKAIFYYTAEERVDFRELIKALAEEFKVRIEMKQIGVRQEASRLGGIGTCGRELCCSTWLSGFKSVTTQAARVQQLSLNPQKLAGQCSKLKCCLNYEYATYEDALKDFPSSDTILKTKKGDAIHQKTDIFRKIMWYSYQNDQSNFMAVTIESVREIMDMNRQGKFPEKLEDFAFIQEAKTEFEHTVGQDDLTRFDD